MVDYRALAQKIAIKHGLDPNMFTRQMLAESSGNPMAHNSSGASGLMQLLPSTGRQYGATNLYDPTQNLNAGASYMQHLVHQFGNIRTALAAYNAGPGRVQRYHGIPPFTETRNYVNKIAGPQQSIPEQVTSTIGNAAHGFMSALQSAGQGAQQQYHLGQLLNTMPQNSQPQSAPPLPPTPPAQNSMQPTKSLIDGSWSIPQNMVRWETG